MVTSYTLSSMMIQFDSAVLCFATSSRVYRVALIAPARMDLSEHRDDATRQQQNRPRALSSSSVFASRGGRRRARMATPAPLAAATPVGGAAAPLPQAIQFRVRRSSASRRPRRSERPIPPRTTAPDALRPRLPPSLSAGHAHVRADAQDRHAVAVRARRPRPSPVRAVDVDVVGHRVRVARRSRPPRVARVRRHRHALPPASVRQRLPRRDVRGVRLRDQLERSRRARRLVQSRAADGAASRRALRHTPRRRRRRMPPWARRFDFTATHDLKELGAHTLVCGVVYTDADGERK